MIAPPLTPARWQSSVALRVDRAYGDKSVPLSSEVDLMFARLRSGMTFSNVTSLMALFVALGGTSAYAIDEWNGSNIQDDTLTGADVRGRFQTATEAPVNGSLTGADISGQAADPASGQSAVNGSLGTNDIFDGSLTGTDTRDNSLTGTDIVESSLGEVPNAASATNATNAATAQSIANGSVHSTSLGTILKVERFVFVPGGGTAQNGHYNTRLMLAGCPAGMMAFNGGAQWEGDRSDDELWIGDFRWFVDPATGRPSIFYVTGGNDTGVERKLIVSVFCLAA
jgi:hypothetical protein